MIKTKEHLVKKIKETAKEIIKVGIKHPGTLRKQYNICGTPKCRCKDPVSPRKHGPYYNLSYTFRGKNSTKFIKQELVPQYLEYTKNYTHFKKLVEELLALNIQLIELKTETRK